MGTFAESNFKIQTDFGKSPNDYIKYCVYDLEDNYIDSARVEGGIQAERVNIQPGRDLRALGFQAGRYKIKYEFIRHRGGLTPEPFFIDANGDVWNGKTREEDGKVYKGDNLDYNNPTTREELFRYDDKYVIHEISPSRTEVRIIPNKQIELKKYNNGFAALTFPQKKYEPFITPTSGEAKINSSDASVVEVTLADEDGGFTQDMVGGTITIKNAFIIGYEEVISYEQVENPNYVASLAPEEPKPLDRDTRAKEIAKEREVVKQIKAQEPKNPLDFTGEDAITQARRTTRVERTTTPRATTTVENTNTNRGASIERDVYDL